MSALVTPEYYADLAATTLNGAYTSGSGTMVVTSAAALSTTRQFHFYISDQTTGAVKCIGVATAVLSNTFAVTMSLDANANSGDNVVISLCAGAMNQIRSDISGVGTFANLPTVAKAGDRYKCTDSALEGVYTGSAWSWFYMGLPVRLPSLTSFTANSVNSSVASSVTKGILRLNTTASGGFGGFQATYSGNKTVIVGFHFIVACGIGGSGLNFSGVGVYVLDSSSGKLIFFDQGTTQLVTQKRSGLNTFVGNYNVQTSPYGFVFFMAIKDDGTNFNFYVSHTLDPNDFMLYDQRSRTDYLTTPDTMGVCFGGASTGQFTLNVFSFSIA